MDLVVDELTSLFTPSAPGTIAPDVMGELQSILRIHSILPQELFFKWESYCLKMGDETKLTIGTVRAFKQDVQDMAERGSKGKSLAHSRHAERRNLANTLRTRKTGNDVFGMLDGLVSTTPQAASKFPLRHGSQFESQAAAKTPNHSGKAASYDPVTPSRHMGEGLNDGLPLTPFNGRKTAGQIIETLNSQIPLPEPPSVPSSEPRIRLTANTDLKKFAYKPMAMRVSEASEVLDERIDQFLYIVQEHYGLEDKALGNAASQSATEVVVVGRIASDAPRGKLNAASVVLEMSRRSGAGFRVPLKLDKLTTFDFFPGQIVALRGVNPSGEFFSVSEILDIPSPVLPASTVATIDAVNQRLEKDVEGHPIQVLVASGPYTADDNLAFEPLRALCHRANELRADALILIGPFLDLEHPMLASGDLDLPNMTETNADDVSLATVFKVLISPILKEIAEAIPNITILLIPSTRDAISKHVSWPQEGFIRKNLGLPKQAKNVSNPITVSFNEVVVGASSQDILYELRRSEVSGGESLEADSLARLSRRLIQQRHFFPLFPPLERSELPRSGTEDGLAIGTMLDTSYLKLGEWIKVRPDVLVIPSALSPFAKVVEGVVVINPGHLSKRRGPGTYARLTINARKVNDGERAAGRMILHKIYDRARVDIVRI